LRDLFIHLHERRGTSWYKAPEYLVQQSIDPRLGKIALHGKTQPVSNATRLEWFLPGRQAPPATLADYEPQTGRAYLPKEYAAWLKSQAGWQQQAFAIHPVITAPPRIISPTSGSVFVLDPDLPNSGSHLLLRSSLDAEVDAAAWRSATLQIIQEGHQHYAVLTPGQHTLMLLPAGDDGSALPIEVSITVKPPVSASVKLQK